MRSGLFVLLVLLASIATAAAAQRIEAKNVCTYQACTPSQWIAVQKPHDSVIKKLVFAIKHANVDKLGQILRDVSNPQSASYGKYLTLEQVGDLTRNHEAFQAVRNYLLANGVSESQIETTKNEEFIVAHVPVITANKLLHANFYVYQHKDVHGKQFLRTEAFTMPEDIKDHIDFIGETVQFPSFSKRVSGPVINAFTPKVNKSISGGRIINGYVTPELINKVYNIDDNDVKSPESTQSLFEALGQNFCPADLALFQQEMGLALSPVQKVIGPNHEEACAKNPEACGEANLDVQYILGIAPNSPTTFWSMDGCDEPFLHWAIHVCNDPTPPLVHSISYGGIENDPPTFRRFDEEVQKLGVRGATVVVSSGDDGVGNFVIRNDPSQCGFNPSFPASSPHVVAVGATQGPEAGAEEIVCSSETNGIITSGGGFSTVFDQPSYQREAVDEFFQNSNPNDLPPLDQFRKQGRAYPDLSLLGYNYIIADDNQFTAESGTSASAPVFASMLSLINGELLARGKPSLGFVNPLLYQLSKEVGVFRDVTKGRNHCGAGRAPQITCCHYGFSATKGFDPVSGLGSVDFLALKRAILRLHNVYEDSTKEEKDGDVSKRIVDFAKIFKDKFKGVNM